MQFRGLLHVCNPRGCVSQSLLHTSRTVNGFGIHGGIIHSLRNLPHNGTINVESVDGKIIKTYIPPIKSESLKDFENKKKTIIDPLVKEKQIEVDGNNYILSLATDDDEIIYLPSEEITSLTRSEYNDDDIKGKCGIMGDYEDMCDDDDDINKFLQ